MFRKLFPDIYLQSAFDLPMQKLKLMDFKGLIFDIDNTLAPHYEPEANQKTRDFIKEALGLGFKVCLLSNNSKKRVTLFNSSLNVHAVHWAKKPLMGGLRKAIELMGTDFKNTVIIGDQIFTDIWCGKRAGLYTVLVNPIVEKDQWMTRVKRGLERKIIRLYEKEILKKEA